MAQALAHVRKDLGKDAMILHTRSFRVGSWFGIGGKTMVEITASSPAQSAISKAPRPMPRVARQAVPAQSIEIKPLIQEPELVTQRGRTVTRQRLVHNTPTLHAASSTITADDSYIERDGAAIETGSAIGSTNGFANGNAQVTDNLGLNGRDALFSDETPVARPTKSIGKKTSKPIEPISARFADQPVVSAMIPTPKPKAAPSPRVHKQSSTTKSNDELRSQIDSLQKMMGQVLESTRKTAVAVETGTGQDALPNGEMPAPLFELYAKMLDNDVPVEMADKLVGSVRDRLDALELKDALIVRQTLLRAIESTIEIRSESLLTIDHSSSNGRPRVIALVGPTGVGKTTTVAKLAATYKLRHGKNVGLITSDTYRIAAVEQLRTYAGIIGLPLKVANSPEELAQAVEELAECDIVVIDTAGRSQNNARRLEELAEFTNAANPDETHLVLSTTVGDNVLRKTAQRFRALGPDRCILTKLDEAVTTGPIAGLSDRIGLPLSFITVGQEVPDDLEPARADRLARCVLDGPEAVVGRWNEDNG